MVHERNMRVEAPTRKFGVLLTAYGTPARVEDVEAFFTHIRGGAKPAPEQVEDLIARYRAIGGSPLAEITQAQADGLAEELNRRRPSLRADVYVGMKHAAPFIAEAVDAMVEAGITDIVGVALAPQYSRMSVGSYKQATLNAAQRHGERAPNVFFVEHWHDHPGYIAALSRRVDAALAGFGLPRDEALHSVHVLFTAHSLPERILEWDDPYPRHLRETGRQVAAQVGLQSWDCAYQSAGQTAVPWLGPDLLDVLRDLAARGTQRVLVCPCGFVADHLEVLYDIDIEAQKLARELGITLRRTASFNADADFVALLADIVEEKLQEALSSVGEG